MHMTQATNEGEEEKKIGREEESAATADYSTLIDSPAQPSPRRTAPTHHWRCAAPCSTLSQYGTGSCWTVSISDRR